MKRAMPLLVGAAAGGLVFWALSKRKLSRDDIEIPLDALQVAAIAAGIAALVLL